MYLVSCSLLCALFHQLGPLLSKSLIEYSFKQNSRCIFAQINRVFRTITQCGLLMPVLHIRTPPLHPTAQSYRACRKVLRMRHQQHQSMSQLVFRFCLLLSSLFRTFSANCDVASSEQESVAMLISAISLNSYQIKLIRSCSYTG